MWNEIILRHGVTPWWNQIWLCQPHVHLCFWLSTCSLLSLSPPSHFRNNVSYSFMYQKLINTLTQVDNTWYKCEFVHTNHIFDTDTNERMGSPKRNPPKCKWAQMSPNEPNKHERARTKAEWAQTNTNEHEQNRTSTSESLTRVDEHERGLPKRMVGWAQMSTNKTERAQTSAKALSGNNTTSRDGQQVTVGARGTGNTTTTRDGRQGRGQDEWRQWWRQQQPTTSPPCSPLSPLFYFIFCGIPM